MPAQTALDDAAHWWGGDLQLTPSGDLARANREDRSRQHVLRRLLTNPGDYIFHPGYGAGVPRRIGTNVNVPEIQGLVRGQMLREESVSKAPAPKVAVREITGGVQTNIAYVALPDRQPVMVSFTVER